MGCAPGQPAFGAAQGRRFIGADIRQEFKIRLDWNLAVDKKGPMALGYFVNSRVGLLTRLRSAGSPSVAAATEGL